MEGITSKQWLNSFHIQSEDESSVLVFEKDVCIENRDTNKILSTKKKFNIIKNPKRTIYITKPECRTYRYKKDYEELKNCDAYTVEDRYLADEIKKILGYPSYKRVGLKDLFNSPYVYNADISLQALVRERYMKKQKHPILPILMGGCDIETSVLGDEQINALTLVCETNVYTVVLKEFMWKYEGDKKLRATKQDIMDIVHDKIQHYLDTYKFTINLHIAETEWELLTWFFDKLHKEKDIDFIGIWNIAYDIPYILDRLKVYQVDPKDYFCHPDIPKDYRVCKFKEDKSNKAFIADKWSYFYCTCYSQFIDSMALYNKVRKTESKEPSYSLDAISTKELGEGKLKFEEGDHYTMQTRRFPEYVVYNMVDAMLLQLMNWKNKDLVAMYYLTDNSPFNDFSKQTNGLRDGYFRFCLEHGRVYATTGNDMKGPYDHLFNCGGGSVLPSANITNMGLKCIVEKPDMESRLIPLAADLDFKAMYPSFQSAAGIAKEMKLATVVGIEGHSSKDIEQFMAGIAMPDDNAVWIGHDYFGLPDYKELKELAQEEFFKLV